MNKNKVEDSQVYLPVEEFTKLEDDRVKSLAQKVGSINKPCYSP